ncbi:MAG: NAD-dependent epimerase/dehydratase family protein [Bacillota bacterium]|nr:NAD-dependent epimerase/dehydratase family protein [Bacillota bacterium]
MKKNTFEEDLEYIARYPLPYEMLNKKTVFITGATGLIGYQLVKSLLVIGEIQIIALVRNIDKVNKIYMDDDKEKIKFIEGDILEPIRIEEKIDYIFHCAAVTTSKIMIEKPVETLMTAVTGTNNVLELAKEKKCKSVVFVSSMEMYGSFSELDKEVTEDMIGYIDPLKVRSNYPESKRLCENMCIAYMEEFGVPVKIARLAQTFGAGILPWENRVFAQFAKSVINQQDIVLHTKGLSEGNYCYTRDCIIGLLTLLLKGINGEAYNIVNPKSHTTISEMANMVADKIADKKIKVLFDIPESNLFGYAADTKMKLNSDKLQKLGWKPEIGLEEAYKRMIACMTQNKSE